MNREIKFRGKTACCQLATAKDVWVYGGVHSIFENDDTCYISVNNYFEKNKSEKLLVKKETIGQYTGLHDKNGKEIYEGDIVKVVVIKQNPKIEEDYIEMIMPVVFDEGEFLLKDYTTAFGPTFHHLRLCKSMKIIGNIYENKNLLEV